MIESSSVSRRPVCFPIALLNTHSDEIIIVSRAYIAGVAPQRATEAKQEAAHPSLAEPARKHRSGHACVRAAHGLLTTTMGKRILYMGRRGYSASLAPKAVATVSANADRLSRMATGVIPGWPSPSINARGDGVTNWSTPDGSPAIISVLQGTADLRQHGKLIVLAN